MSTTNKVTETTREQVKRLIATVEQWKLLEAIEQFYADDVVMQENLNPPTVGIEANLERERAFVASVAKVNEMHAEAVVVDGDRAVINWHQDITNTNGERFRFDQLSFQEWKDGKIVRERFVYDPNTLAAKE
jgi:ketosteroid isomerase-like protein